MSKPTRKSELRTLLMAQAQGYDATAQPIDKSLREIERQLG